MKVLSVAMVRIWFLCKRKDEISTIHGLYSALSDLENRS